MFLFGKLPVEIQQEHTMANKEESSPEEMKTYLMRNYQYQQYTSPQTTIQPFNAVTSSNTTTNTSTTPTATTALPERKRFEGQCFYCGKPATENPNVAPNNAITTRQVQPQSDLSYMRIYRPFSESLQEKSPERNQFSLRQNTLHNELPERQK